ncbi:MAG: hypothetical protein LC121_06840 [Anaerolineae bacterium]|nr:hypothetical protein [Anaerolineae bacterium]
MTETITLDEWADQFTLRPKSRALWKAIRWEFEEQRPPMTVRQMFYRMSAIGQVPKTEGGYRQVQYALTAMRRQGAIPYDWLADNTRWRRKPRTYSGLAAMLRESQALYRRALWDNQLTYVEIWLEKDALAGVVYDVTERWDVPLYVTRGYPSLSYLYDAAEHLRSIDKPIFIYHFGDYDASGADAARSVRDGLRGFGAEFHFVQAAVTEWQIGALGLQTRPAKRSDPRARNWGSEAVELDAIPPDELRRMVNLTIEGHIDRDALAALEREQAAERESLEAVIDGFLY